MSALFSLLIFASESKEAGAVLAPEVLDAHRLQEWLAGSVWALIGLNLIALSLFLTALVAPQINSIKAEIKKYLDAFMAWRAAKIQAKLEAQKEAAAKAAEEKAKREAEEAARLAEEKARKMSDDGLPAISTAAAETAPAAIAATPTTELPPPPPLEEPSKTEAAATSPQEEVPPQREPFGLDEKTEVLEVPPPAEEAATKLESVSSSEVSDKTEEIPLPSDPPLPQTNVSAEKNKSVMASETFDQSLDELLKSDTSVTEEVSIFDTKAIDDALKDVLDKDSPR